MFLLFLAIAVAAASTPTGTKAVQEESTTGFFRVEGEAIFPRDAPRSAAASSRVLLNHGAHVGFVRDDGHFVVDGVPAGSYIVQLENVDYVFEPLRVDITAKGKMRARKLTVLQPNSVQQLPYPLKMAAREPARYFRKREEWRVTDMLMSPMVLMVALPLVFMLILPRITANDPEMRREMENMQLPKMEMPDVSDMLASFMGGGPKKPTAQKKQAIQKRRT